MPCLLLQVDCERIYGSMWLRVINYLPHHLRLVWLNVGGLVDITGVEIRTSPRPVSSCSGVIA